jgi:hypothetical protein
LDSRPACNGNPLLDLFIRDIYLKHVCFSEADAQALSYAGSEIKEGLSAAKEKRKPEFKANL